MGPRSIVTARRPIPKRHWRSSGSAPLPPGAEALDEPFAAFTSWFMRITCDRCGKDRMLNEVHTPPLQRAVTLRILIDHMRHDGCRSCCERAEVTGSTPGPAGPEAQAAQDRAGEAHRTRLRGSLEAPPVKVRCL
jgi:hypothetical protein